MQTVNARRIQPVHEARDADKLAALISAMETGGWQGRPLLVQDAGNELWAVTGSHRLAAARKLEMEIPVVITETDFSDCDDDDARLERAYEANDQAAIALLEIEIYG